MGQLLRFPKFLINRVPLVAIDAKSNEMRRYTGREVTHEATLDGMENADRAEVLKVIEDFRVRPHPSLRADPPVRLSA
jgi:hypothetical protein